MSSPARTSSGAIAFASVLSYPVVADSCRRMLAKVLS